MADGYTLKEMIEEVRNDNKQALTTQASILATLQGIDGHLSRLNSEVATHAKKINSLEQFQTRAMVVWSFAVFILVTAVNQLLWTNQQ